MQVKLHPNVRAERVQFLESIVPDIINAVCEMDIVNEVDQFKDQFILLTIRGNSENARGGFFRVRDGGKPYAPKHKIVYGIKMGLHDRFFDPIKYNKERVRVHTHDTKSNWMKARVSLDKYGLVYSPEYVRFDHDSEIGGIYSNHRRNVVKMTVVHEIAHCLVYWNQNHSNRKGYAYPKPHGEVWKSIYRKLRRELVNPHVHKIGG